MRTSAAQWTDGRFTIASLMIVTAVFAGLLALPHGLGLLVLLLAIPCLPIFLYTWLSLPRNRAWKLWPTKSLLEKAWAIPDVSVLTRSSPRPSIPHPVPSP